MATHLREPVRLQTCIVGQATFDEAAMRRALGARLASLEGAGRPNGYDGIVIPRVLPTSEVFESSREAVEHAVIAQGGGAAGGGGKVASNPCGSSINWSAAVGMLSWGAVAGGQGHWEVTAGATGVKLGATKKNENTDAGTSRLSKLRLFRTARGLPGGGAKGTYAEAKAECLEYCRAKEKVREAMKGIGGWVGNKDARLEEFGEP